MQEKLVGYMLRALEAEEIAFVHELIQYDLEVRRQLEILRRGLDPLEGDNDHVDAPPGLAVRTCQRIHEARISTRE